ncbi:hypothetical protein HYC85_004305 [Camellia sinensis]|uniref:Uncharacterized protein n=1 Tax=Camellia sinensis TaxID=4442 RepID=A0A7J7HW61_CAMSI|nr:hypothetical protein HYC85_004305 [Camellia sinensis]
MDFWPQFVASSWGREFVAGGFGGVAGIVTGYPLDTLRIRQQQHSTSGSAFGILRRVVASDGPLALYRGMAAPLASVTFQLNTELDSVIGKSLTQFGVVCGNRKENR